MKFRTKLTLCILVILSLSFGAVGSILIGAAFTDSLKREKENAVSIFTMTAESIQLLRSQSQNRLLSDAVQTLSRLNRETDCAAMSLENERGVLFAQGGAALLQSPVPESGCAMALTRVENRQYIELCGPLQAGEGRIVLRLTFDATHIFTARRSQLQTYFAAYLSVMLLGGAITMLLTRYLTGPLQMVTHAAEQIGNGNHAARVQYSAPDEFGTLSVQFNAMAQTLQEQMEQLQEDLNRQERFLGAFAHELKTPMTSIIGYGDLIRADALDTADRMKAGAFLYSEGKRLERLSWRLLELMALKNEPPTLHPVSVEPLLTALADRLRPIYARQNIRLSVQCGADSCLAEPDLLQSLLENLLDNARKALPEGGEILLSAIQQGSGVLFSVRDNGIGIPEDALAHISEPFYRVDKARSRAAGGVGLGLSLCQEIARLHGTELNFVSKVVQGTGVSFSLEVGCDEN